MGVYKTNNVFLFFREMLLTDILRLVSGAKGLLAYRFLRLLILAASICWLSVEACPASSTQSYLFKNSVLKSQQSEYIPFLLAQQSQDSATVNKTSSLKLKNPYMAIFYSVVPGLLIHGSGHFYAGKTNTGYLLLGTEAAGLLLLYLGFENAFGGPAYQNDADIMGWTGFALFSGSWIYDAIGSPIAVKKQNQKLLKRKNTELRFQPKDSGLRLVLVYHF
jgi:TM2 domain-containing membrane protein YozV